MRVLLVASAVGRSHLTRLLLVADALRERGGEPLFAYAGSARELLAERGYERLDVADVAVDDYAADVFAAYTADVLETAVGDLRRALADSGARIVVFDLHPAAPIAARAAGVPSVSVTNADLTAGFDRAGAFADPLEQPRRHRRAERAARPFVAIRARSAATAMRRVARRHGHDGRTLWDFQRGDLTLLADLAQWAPSVRLAPGTQYVGPLVWDEPAAGALRPTDPRRTLYVTIGNTGRRELLDLAVEAFPPDAGMQLVLSSGASVEPPRYGLAHVQAQRFVRGSQAARGSALVIHCGGNGTTYQALAAARPMVVVPFSAGQRINAQLAVHHRAGVAFTPAGLRSQRLRAAVEAILRTPGYRVTAAGFAARLRRCDGPAAAADAILALAAGRVGRPSPGGAADSR